MKKILMFILIALSVAAPALGETEKALFEKGVVQMKESRFHKAIETFTRLIAMVPDNPDVYKNRGVAHMKLNQYELAITDFEKAREIKPDMKGLYSNLGVAWFYKGDYARAVRNYNMEITLTPDNYHAYFNRAICRVELGDYAPGLKDVEKALALSPKFYLAQCLKGDILAKTGRHSQARAAYEHAGTLDPEHPYVKKRLADLDRTHPAVASPPRTDGVVVKKISPPAGPRENQGETDGKPATVALTAPESPKQAAAPGPDVQADPPGAALEPASAVPQVQKTSGYALQAGAFRSRANAEKRHQALVDNGYRARVLQLTRPSGLTWFLVRIGNYTTRADADRDLARVKGDLAMDIIVRPAGRF